MLLEVMEPGSDLDEALHEDAFGAGELAPHLLPELMRAEVLTAVERRAPLLELVRGFHHGPIDGYTEGITMDRCGAV